MPRPKKQPQDRVKKDAFSGPQYLIAAAKQAAGVPAGRDFSPWVVSAIREKLEREHPGLLERVRQLMQSYAQSHATESMVAEEVFAKVTEDLRARDKRSLEREAKAEHKHNPDPRK